ncbi:Transcriptional repressor protein KorB [compost metagenome]
MDLLTGKSDAQATHPAGAETKAGRSAASDKLKKAIVHVRHNDRTAHLMLDRRPPAEGFAWLKYTDDGAEFEASLKSVTLVALLEG